MSADPEEASSPLEGASAWGLSLGPGPAPRSEELLVPEARRYVAVGEVGAGGMGVVEAVHDLRLGRDVARKTLALHDGDGVLALLLHEARITSRLDHPNIVPVHDVGQDAEGRWYFTMRLVRGETLASVFAARKRASERLPALLGALVEACRALAHAHERGVVHGDLKPSNLLIGPHGELQVADWGLARELSADASPVPPDAGTPPWRAPEVSATQPPTPASDVYALGLLLRQVLTGSVDGPLEGAPIELIAVVQRATATDPATRYPDAGALGAEISRWLEGRPVRAHAYTPGQLLTRLVRAWAAPLAVAAVASLVLAVVVAVSVVRTAAERDRAVAAEAAMRVSAGALWSAQAVAALRADDRPTAIRAATAALSAGPSPSARGVLAAYRTPPPAVLAESQPLPPCAAGVRLHAEGTLCLTDHAVERLSRSGATLSSWPVEGAADAFWTRHGDVMVLAGGRLVRIDPNSGQFTPVRWVHAERGLVASGSGAYVDRLSVTLLEGTGEAIAPCDAHDNIETIAMGSRGDWWAVCSGGRVVRGDLTAQVRVLAELGNQVGLVTAMAVDEAAGRVFVGTTVGEVLTLSTTTGQPGLRLQTGLGVLRELAVAPDGVHALAYDRSGALMLWRVEDGATLGRVDAAGVRSAMWTSATTFSVAADTLDAWRLTPDARPSRWTETGGVSAVTVSEDGRRVAVGVGPRLVVRTLPDGQAVHTSEPHTLPIKGIVSLDGGRQMLSGAVDQRGALVRTELATGEARRFDEAAGVRRLVALSGERALASTFGQSMWWIDGPATAPRRQVRASVLRDLAADAAADHAWGLDEAGAVLRIAPDGAERELTRRPHALRIVGSSDGALVVVSEGHRVVVLRATDGAEVGSWSTGSDIAVLAIDPTSAWVAAGTVDGGVALGTLHDPHPIWQVPGHVGRVSALTFLPDGTLVSAGWDAVVRLWGPEPAPVDG